MTTIVEQHIKDYTAEFGPQTEHERFLVASMAHARWKLGRLAEIEAQLFEIIVAGLATPAQERALASFQKYTAAAERTYYRAVRELQAGRKSAAKAQAQALIREMHAIGQAPLPTFEDFCKSEPQPVAPKTAAAPRRL